MRANRSTCPGCGWWYPTTFTQTIVGPGEFPRVVVCDGRVPVKALGYDVEQIHAWSLSGWAGVVHTCVTDLPTLEMAGWIDTRPWWQRHRRQLVATVMVAAVDLTVLLWVAVGKVWFIALGLVVTAIGYTLVEEMNGVTPEVPNWRSDRRGRYRQ